MSSNTFKVYSYPYSFVNENWGTVNTPATESVDLGLVSASITDQESYGLVTEQIELEYNGVITVSGGSDPAYEDYGFIVDAASYEDYESIISLFTPYEDLGFLEIPDSFVESVSYSYNIDSIEFFEGYFDVYGALADSVTYEDNGSIVVTSGVTYEDYGLIFWNNQTIYPYGTILITDAATGDKEINAYVGSGEISFVGIASAVEKITKVEEDKTLLGTFSGTSVEKFQKGSFVASGAFSAFGSKVESRSYSYNEDSIYIIDSSEDYGFISTSVTSIDDYGSSLGAGLTAYGDYGVLLPTQFPYGTILISGAALDNTELPRKYEGSGEIAISGIASAVEKKTSVDAKTVLGTFSGVGNDSRVKSYVGSGSVGIFSGLSESRTYNYNIDSIDIFEGYFDPYGALPDSVTYEDLGFITTSLVYEDYGYIVNLDQTTYPYGTINISGSVGEKEVESYVGSGEISFVGIASAVEKITKVEEDKTLLGTFSGTSVESFQEGVYIGSGAFSAFGSKVESRSYSYTKDSIYIVDTAEDYGSISTSVTSIDDYGSSLGAGLTAYNDYGVLLPVEFPYGTILISGAADDATELPKQYTGSGEIAISGIASAVEKKTSVDSKTLLGTFSGVGNDSRVKSYVGSGSVGIFSGLSESRTYNYNIDSIDIFTGYENYGSIEDSTTYEDWGLITSLVGYEGYEDYGFIFNNNQTTYPYGTIAISGSVGEKEVESYVGSGEIAISGIASAVEKTTKVEEDKTLLGTFSGVGNDSRVKSYIGSGSVGIFSGLSESVTYDYNIDSINTFAGIENYGAIDASPTEPTEDYGTIDASPTEPTEDYELIIFSGDVVPYGTIVISGSSIDDIDVEFIHIGSGEIAISGIASAVEKITKVEEDKTLLGTFSGVGNDSRVKSYVGLGTFEISGGSEGPYEDLGFITDSVSYEDLGLVTDFSTYYLDYGFVVRFEFVESVTYSYNIDSIDIFEGYFDPYGALPDSVTYEDLGFITTSLVYDDYGYIVNLNQTTYPYGTIVITDVLIEQDVNSYVGDGSITVSRDVAGVATAIYSRTRALDGVGLGTFSGTSAESFQKGVYTGSGSVGIFSGLSESRTYDYNEDSIYIVDTSEDYGSVGVAVTTFDDYGSSLGAGLTAYNDYGVLLTGNLTPYGTIVISGATDLDEQTRVFSHLGSGSIGIFSGTAEVVGWNPPDKTVDILISGQAQTAYEEENIFSGIGTLSVDGSKVERRTYNYNIDSTSLTYESQDNGLITDSPDTAEIDGGSVTSLPDQDAIDYGLITVDGTKLPYGTIVISGAITNEQGIFVHQGSGSIGIFSGTAEVFGANPPDQTVNIIISGDAATRYEAEYTEVGIGTVNVSGFATDERRTFAHLGSGQIDIGGDADAISNVPSPTSGTIDVFGRAGESFTPATHVGIGTGFIDGEKLESRTYIYNETSINPYIIEDNGSIADPATYEDRGILSDIVIYEDYGFVFDDKTRIPYDGYIQISGTSVDDIDDVYTYNGSGTIGIGASADPVFYTPEYPGIGTITVSGSALESKTPATYIGVGTGEFSVITGSAEVVGWNPPDQTVDIVISGVGSERFTTLQTYSGIGTISIGGTASPVFYTPEYPGSGTIVVSGSADPVHYVPNYPGIGTIFAITGAAEAFGAKPPVVPADIIITGVGSEAYAPGTYSGIGTIFVSGVGIAVSNPYREPFVFVTII